MVGKQPLLQHGGPEDGPTQGRQRITGALDASHPQAQGMNSLGFHATAVIKHPTNGAGMGHKASAGKRTPAQMGSRG